MLTTDPTPVPRRRVDARARPLLTDPTPPRRLTARERLAAEWLRWPAFPPEPEPEKS